MKFLIFAATVATASATIATLSAVPLMKTEYQSQVNHVIGHAAPVLMAAPKVFAAPMIARPAIATLAAPAISTWASPAISTFAAPKVLAAGWGAPAISTFGALDYAATKLW